MSKTILLTLLTLLTTAAARPAIGSPQDDPKQAAERPADAAELDRFLESWAGALGDLKSLEIRFKQEKRLKILKRPLVSRGTIRLAEGKLLCEVKDRRGVLESAMLVDGDKLKILYPRLKRLETYELGSGHTPAMTFPVFGADPKAVKRDFEVALYVSKTRNPDEEEEGTIERRRLALKPKDPKAPIAALSLVFDGFEVKEVEQRDRRGDSVRLILEKTLQNPKLHAGDLKLDVPPGTREVRPSSRK